MLYIILYLLEVYHHIIIIIILNTIVTPYYIHHYIIINIKIPQSQKYIAIENIIQWLVKTIILYRFKTWYKTYIHWTENVYCAFVVLLNERNIYNKRMNLIRCFPSTHSIFVIVFVRNETKRFKKLTSYLQYSWSKFWTLSFSFIWKSFILNVMKWLRNLTEKNSRKKLLRLDNKFKAGFVSSHKLSWFEFDAFLCVSGMKKVSSMLLKIAWQP